MLCMSAEWRMVGSPPQLLAIDFPVPTVLSLVAAGSMEPDSHERAELLKRLCVPAEKFVRVRQEHTRLIVEAQPGRVDVGDGLVTDRSDLALGVTVGDCMPIVASDPRRGCFALLHSGRRGTGILRAAVTVLTERYGSRAADVHVLLGPAIGAEQYRVDEQTAAQFAEEFGETHVRTRDGAWWIDLRSANRSICSDMGISHVYDIDRCTYADRVFGSYRREGPGYTRMLMVAGAITMPKERST